MPVEGAECGLEQLEENIGSLDVKLDRDIVAEIDAVHAKYPNPTP
ncbi:hypothetical protein [Oscillatoria nigro-viridis]|nr:hypothetical protein [Oscillatoria nigro-viridis]